MVENIKCQTVSVTFKHLPAGREALLIFCTHLKLQEETLKELKILGGFSINGFKVMVDFCTVSGKIYICPSVGGT